MSYFVTGATGFIGRNLVELLLEREGTIYVLVREGSKGRLEELRNRWESTPTASSASSATFSGASGSRARTRRCFAARSITSSISPPSTT